MSFPARHPIRVARLAAGLFIVAMASCQTALATPSDCTRIESDTQRLACFDREFPAQTQQQAAAPPGAWQVQKPGGGDAMISRASEREIQCRWTPRRHIQLHIQCKDNVTAIAFETGCYMTSSQYRNYGHVTYQLDRNSPRIAEMIAGADNHSLGFWTGDAAIPFIRELLGKGRLTVKMTPYAEDPVSAVFDLHGLEAALRPVRQQCGW